MAGVGRCRLYFRHRLCEDANETSCGRGSPSRLVFVHADLGALAEPTVIGNADVELLAEDCANDKRYEFMVVSAPLHVVGGFASPPNAVAIR
jgi:hypothetical protein